MLSMKWHFGQLGFLGMVIVLGACAGDDGKGGSGGDTSQSASGGNDDQGNGGTMSSGGEESGTGGMASGGKTETGGSDTAAVSFSDLDGAAKVSELSDRETMAFCKEFDTRLGLIDDLDASCQYEAWLRSSSEAVCTEIKQLCSDAGMTLAKFELASECATVATTLPDCEATVDDLIACAEEESAFATARTCAEADLFDTTPTCLTDVIAQCPTLYGVESGGGGTGGDLGTGGISGSGQCNGVSSSCFSQFNSFSCNSQQGCFWSSSSNSCSGVASSCYAQFDSFSCNSQDGCYWSF